MRGFFIIPAILVVALSSMHAQSELVIQKEGTKLYHRPGCPVVKDGKGVLAMSRAQAEARGVRSHPECDPAKAEKAASGAAAKSEPPAPVLVRVDGTKYYHRDACRRLRAGSKRVNLEQAGKKYWPCPACKPPVRPRPEPAIPRRIRG